MNEAPEFWRVEVWHPLSVHFPIALLITATIFKGVAYFNSREVWSHGGSILLIAGVITSWIAIYTGDLADGTVSRTICDPTILKDHENGAYVLSWLFTAAALPDLVYTFKLYLFKKNEVKTTVIIILLIGSGYLIYVGHLGATLVYQQGAGVYKPAEDCPGY